MSSALRKIDLQKTSLYVGGALLLVILLLVVRKMIRKAKAERKDEELQELVEKAVVDSELSYPEAQYVTMADSLESYLAARGFDGGLLGADQAGVYDIMGMMYSDADIYKLINVFGTRQLKDKSLILIVDWLKPKQDYNLPGAIAAMLTKGERRKVNEILRENGLTYQF